MEENVVGVGCEVTTCGVGCGGFDTAGGKNAGMVLSVGAGGTADVGGTEYVDGLIDEVVLVDVVKGNVDVETDGAVVVDEGGDVN